MHFDALDFKPSEKHVSSVTNHLCRLRNQMPHQSCPVYTSHPLNKGNFGAEARSSVSRLCIKSMYYCEKFFIYYKTQVLESVNHQQIHK